ncbi:hypothetical protein WDW37_08070 [Bdellovibrionota bacterium FG-1]
MNSPERSSLSYAKALRRIIKKTPATQAVIAAKLGISQPTLALQLSGARAPLQPHRFPKFYPVLQELSQCSDQEINALLALATQERQIKADQHDAPFHGVLRHLAANTRLDEGGHPLSFDVFLSSYGTMWHDRFLKAAAYLLAWRPTTEGGDLVSARREFFERMLPGVNLPTAPKDRITFVDVPYDQISLEFLNDKTSVDLFLKLLNARDARVNFKITPSDRAIQYSISSKAEFIAFQLTASLFPEEDSKELQTINDGTDNGRLAEIIAACKGNRDFVEPLHQVLQALLAFQRKGAK